MNGANGLGSQHPIAHYTRLYSTFSMRCRTVAPICGILVESSISWNNSKQYLCVCHAAIWWDDFYIIVIAIRTVYQLSSSQLSVMVSTSAIASMSSVDFIARHYILQRASSFQCPFCLILGCASRLVHSAIPNCSSSHLPNAHSFQNAQFQHFVSIAFKLKTDPP